MAWAGSEALAASSGPGRTSLLCSAFGPEGLQMRGHLQAVGKEPSKPGHKRHLCSKPACLGHTNNNGPPKSARSPKSIHSPKNTLSSPCQCPGPPAWPAAVPASWLLSSLLEQLQQPGGIKMHQGNSTSALGLCQQGSALKSVFLPVRMGKQEMITGALSQCSQRGGNA